MFQPTLQSDEDGVVSLILKDELSNAEMHLERLSVLAGKEIPEPIPFGSQGDDDLLSGPSGEPSRETSTVPEETVSLARRVATASLQIAGTKGTHQEVQTNERVRTKLEEKRQAVQEALAQLPSSGPADQEVYQQLWNRTTELRAFLDTRKLLTAEERKLLSQ